VARLAWFLIENLFLIPGVGRAKEGKKSNQAGFLISF
jgi:hypothetical protein